VKRNATPISGLPEIGSKYVRKSGKPDLRGPSEKRAKHLMALLGPGSRFA
jgi:hypothetical protein